MIWILIKSLYYEFNITDDDGTPFIIKEEAPQNYYEI